MKTERRGQITVLICSCCNLPFAKVQFGRLVIQSKHHGDEHSNALNLEELKDVLKLLTDDDAIIAGVPR